MIVELALGAAAALLATELALSWVRHPFLRARLKALEAAALQFGESVDDSQRQHAVVKGGLNLMGATLWAAVLLAILGVAIYVPAAFAESTGSKVNVALIASGLMALVYGLVRARSLNISLRAEPTTTSADIGSMAFARYGLLARLLHWMALEPALVRQTSFEFERLVFERSAHQTTTAPRSGGPVFICGLARSGTTVLLDILNSTGEFSSPTYRDMPFVLAPNTWAWISGVSRRQSSAAQRAHGDGIAVSADSPESFEEVFWRTFCEPVPGPGLAYEEPSAKTLQRFASYQALSLMAHQRQHHGLTGPRYLSKNNNNVLRLSLLLQDTTARVVLVVRDPLETAWSLCRQHQRFEQLQGDDPFVRAYMHWLGHHEFGSGHRPFAFAQSDLVGLRPEQPDYWLVYWTSVHKQLLAIAGHPNVLTVSHDLLCAQPVQGLQRLFEALGVHRAAEEFAPTLQARPSSVSDLKLHFNPELVFKANAIYTQMLVHAQLIPPQKAAA